jgi:hypothetical protein
MHLLEKARATGNSYRALLLIVVLQCCSASALSSPHVGVRIDENTDGLDFHGSVMIFIDSLGIYGRLSGPGWPPASAYTKSFSPGKYKGGDIWCRFHLQNESSEDREFILEAWWIQGSICFLSTGGQRRLLRSKSRQAITFPIPVMKWVTGGL